MDVYGESFCPRPPQACELHPTLHPGPNPFRSVRELANHLRNMSSKACVLATLSGAIVGALAVVVLRRKEEASTKRAGSPGAGSSLKLYYFGTSARAKVHRVQTRLLSLTPPHARIHHHVPDLAGKAEASRLIATYGGIDLEDIRFKSRDEFIAMKTSGELPYGQVGRGRPSACKRRQHVLRRPSMPTTHTTVPSRLIPNRTLPTPEGACAQGGRPAHRAIQCYCKGLSRHTQPSLTTSPPHHSLPRHLATSPPRRLTTSPPCHLSSLAKRLASTL